METITSKNCRQKLIFYENYGQNAILMHFDEFDHDEVCKNGEPLWLSGSVTKR
jgi:hypothetical protein